METNSITPVAATTPESQPEQPVKIWTHGEPLLIEIQPFALEDYQKAYDWKYRGLTLKQRPQTFESFVASQVIDGGKKLAEYVENQAYLKMEKLCFTMAKLQNITPQDAAAQMKFQLREA